MAKKMDPNVKLVNEISKAIGAVDVAVESDPAGLAISKGARSALNRIKSLADAIKVPTEEDAARIAHERKLAVAAIASKAKAEKAKSKGKGKAKSSKAKPTKPKRKAKSSKAKRSKPKAAPTSTPEATGATSVH